MAIKRYNDREGTVTTVNYYRWNGRDGDAPTAGGYGSLGYDWEQTDKDHAEFVEFPYTTWGDYVGGTVERSNYNSLLRDFPDTFIHITGGYFSHTLYLPMPYGPNGQALVEIMAGLENYPLYDEEDHSQLEMDIAWDAWEQYLKADIVREWEIDTDDWTDDDWEFVKGRYYSLTWEQDYGPESESADSVHFPFHNDVLASLTQEIQTLGLEHDPRRPNPNQIAFDIQA